WPAEWQSVAQEVHELRLTTAARAAQVPEPGAQEVEVPPTPPASEHGDMDVDAGVAAAHMDSLGEASCREHLKACGLEFEDGDDGSPSAQELRERLKRHLGSVARVAKKLK
ncbi:unnamed protein product, partial [Prorocentrum cordatum]